MTPSRADQPIPGEHRHKPELDGIRGLAILLVLGSHAVGILGVLPHVRPHPVYVSLVAFLLVPGWGGVDLFFVLSGFLITGILLRTRTEPAYFRSFYMRRALRIFPIYYLALVASLVFVHFVPSYAAHLPAEGWARNCYFFYLQSVPFLMATRAADLTTWGVYWSLAAEEQFYLVWPSLIRLLRPRVMLGICLAAFVLALPLRMVLIRVYFGMQVNAIHFTPDRMDGMFLGAAVALYMYIWKRNVPRGWIRIAASVGVVILLWIAAFHTRELVGNGRLYTYGVSAFALLGASLVALSQYHLPRLQRWLTWRPLILAGKYSYGIYVFHVFVYDAFHWALVRLFPAFDGELPVVPALGVIVLAMFASCLVAKLSFDLFESRVLSLKRFFPAKG